MTINAHTHGASTSEAGLHHSERRPAANPGAAHAGTGLGGNSVALIVQEHCPDMLAAVGVVIEHLDAQAGTWQFSADAGQTWRGIRTDLITGRATWAWRWTATRACGCCPLAAIG